MDYYVLKLKGTEYFIGGYANKKMYTVNTLMNALMFYSVEFINEFIKKYADNNEIEIYKITLEKIIL